MWETEWASQPPPGALEGARASQVDVARIAQVCTLLWAEHCVECAVPECYAHCHLYAPRRDRKCARLRYGVFPNPDFTGLYSFGADVWFRRWGKLEARLSSGTASVAEHRSWAEREARTLRRLHAIADLLQPVDPQRRVNGAYNLVRQRQLDRAGLPTVDDARFDELVVEVFNPQAHAVELVLEVHQDRLRCRKSLTLAPGANLHRIPFDALDVNLARPGGRILVQPADDAEVRLVFTWLDLVRYTARASSAAADPRAHGPASKVKCVAWDLDETLWTGILVEHGAEALTLNDAARELVVALDERGILQTIVSKNEHDAAWEAVSRFGLDPYFLSPAINWGRKSENLRQIAEQLNLGLDSFAVIDDSAFERGEIEHELPSVRVYDAALVPTLLSRPEFDVPISDETRQRRLSYLAEGQRRQIAERYGDDFAAFLRSCEMRLELFRPDDPRSAARCVELLQRSNQLNLSTRRYSSDEFQSLVGDPAIAPIALRSRDRYGDYGTVGFLALDLADPTRPIVRDFVLSCRVAGKKVEAALFEALRGELKAQGATRLAARFLPTARNGVLLSSLREVGFAMNDEDHGAAALELDLEVPVRDGDVVTVARDTTRLLHAGAGHGTAHAG